MLDNDKEWHEVLQQCPACGFPQQIRELFVHMMVNCKVSDLKSLWESHWKQMVDDILFNQRKLTGNPLLQLNEKQLEFFGLAEIHKLLKSIGKSLKEFNQMPQPPYSYLDCSGNSLIIEETSYDMNEMEKEFKELHENCNKEQLEVYNKVMNLVEMKEGGLFFIYGSGGCGVNSVDEMIHSTFPNLLENYKNPEYLSERAILTPTNQTVDQETMGFNKYNRFSSLNDSTTDWTIRVRAQAIWKGITRQTGEFRGYNIIFFDDSSERIHAFISPEIFVKWKDELEEGKFYIVHDFKVKYYNGNETNRAIRNDKHIYFTFDTKLEKDVKPGLKIPDYNFDFYKLEDMVAMKTDNHFLTDVVAVIQDIQPKAMYIKDTREKSHVQFSITNGKTFVNVTFFNEFADSFLKAREEVVEEPVIIIIGSCKVSDWKGGLYLTSFPATRFFLNPKHRSVNLLRQRFKLYTLCSDNSGTIPIIWPNDEICRLTGKTIYDVDADENEVGDGDKFPPMLKFGVKKTYNFTLCITKENIKESSNVYKATQICGPLEAFDTHSPNDKKNSTYATEIDHNCRMQAFIPGMIADRFGKMLQVQKLYIIKNFHVKEYKDEDKYMPVQTDKQLIFTIDTKVKEIAETYIFIPKNMFDFFKFEDIIKLAKQHVYLADVIGIANKKEVIGKLSNFTNSLGKQQTNIKFKISDGKLEDPNFSKHDFSNKRKIVKVCTIAEIKKLPEMFIEEEVVCKTNIKWAEETKNWNYGVWSSCYEDVQSEEGKYCCQKCPREVLEPIPRCKMNGSVSDETGVIEIVIKDREIRSLLGNNFDQFEIEDKDYPKIRELLLEKDYTMKLLIKEDNIKLQDIVYEATNIFLGFNLDEEMLDPQQSLTNRDSFTGEPSGSSYNLDEILKLNNQ
ncbi:hypothetical protein POM88_023596 [Heracleum sosnowskyi]|uniref:Replication protein A 70 kDa DNA-binding subunit B/D first OB fold domain-containing protein n=1 Tax=Heracleum sosnowskyi TaxID=360622 RepID=A0AAD8MUK9_9APIA|nr:hypothetical protein POM88_023596 [Heracleum sosnowskyi]